MRSGRTPHARLAPILVAVLAALLSGCATYDPAVFDVRLRAATFDRYWSALDEDYPWFELAGVDWDDSRARYRPVAVAAATPGDFYQVVAAMLADLDDPHVAFDVGLDAFEMTGERCSTLDLTLASIGRRLYVMNGPDGLPIAPPPDLPEPAPYPELVAIDGWGLTPQLLPILCTGPVGSTVELTLVWPDGRATRAAFSRPGADPEITPAWRLVPAAIAPQLGRVVTALPAPAPAASDLRGDDWLTVRRVGSIGYLGIRTFLPAGGHDAIDRRVEELDAAIDALADSRGLVVDLQGNGGGSIRLAKSLLERLVLRTAVIEELEIKGPLGLIRASVPWEVEPRRPYRGRLAVLIDGGTGSASEECASLLQAERRAMLIGEATSGAQSRIVRVDGPDGTRLQFGGRRFRSGLFTIDPSSNRSWQGIGVQPDVGVPLTLDAVRRDGLLIAAFRARTSRLREAFERLSRGAEPPAAAEWIDLVAVQRFPVLGTQLRH